MYICRLSIIQYYTYYYTSSFSLFSQKESCKRKEDMSEEAELFDYIINPEKFMQLLKKFRDLRYRGESKKLGPVLREMLQAGILKRIPRRAVRVWMTSFLIPKVKKQSMRVILNAIPLNSMQEMVPGPLDLASLKDIETLVAKYNFFCETDGKSWYHQFVLPPKLLPYFAVRVKGRTYGWATLPMGWQASVKIGHAATNVLYQGIEKQRILTFIDNGYSFANDTETLTGDLQNIQQRADRAGAEILVTTQPTVSGTILGVHVDLQKKTLSLPVLFLQKLAALREAFKCLQRRRFFPSHRLIWKVLGTLFWATRILGIQQCQFLGVMLWVRGRSRRIAFDQSLWDKPCFMSKAFIADLVELIDTVEKNRPRKVNEKSVASFEIFVDASDQGWGLAWTEHGDLKYKAGRFPFWLKDSSIAYKELYAAEQGMNLVRQKNLRNSTLISDNKNVVSWLTRWRAGPPKVMSWLKKLFWFKVKGYITEVMWCPSDRNLADKPSRCIRLDDIPSQGGDRRGVERFRFRKTTNAI